MGPINMCCQGTEMSRGKDDKLKKLPIDGEWANYCFILIRPYYNFLFVEKFPTVFYHKNYKADKSDKDYFYNSDHTY